jgi:hypothetical protein
MQLPENSFKAIEQCSIMRKLRKIAENEGCVQGFDKWVKTYAG